MNTTVHSVKTISEAYQLLQSHGSALKVIAGGTDLMVLYNGAITLPEAILDIWRVDELRNISETDTHLNIGALCSYTQLINDERVKRYAPTLVAASRTIGAVQIQNRGTLGGNIVNGSPAGDSLPVLAAFDAELELGSSRGTRRVAFNQFYTGYRQNVLAADELLLAIYLPKQRDDEMAQFYKVGTRAAQAISKVVMSVRATITSDNDEKHVQEIAISLGSVAPTVIRAPQTEVFIKGQLIDQALMDRANQALCDEVKPISDIRSTQEYRRRVSGNLIAKFLREAQMAK